jgi:hypothetical protein
MNLPQGVTKLTTKEWDSKSTSHYVGLFMFVMPGHDRIHIRVTISRDSYDFQSYAIAEALNEDSRQWNPIAYIPYPLMSSTRVMRVNEWSLSGHKADIEVLLHEVVMLFG